ncbi:MAG: sigma-54-dependent Fis family transcriptional regulator [Planctomycetes bacterium]|nr:sigma-54-dependent Fis family transcriptional regulator [Planctomycetota bacterium]
MAGTREDGGATRLLLVDDDPGLREVLRADLTDRGYEVLARARAAEGLATLEAGAPIDVVITDLNLPGESGLDLCARSARARPEVPVLVITGHGSLEAAVGAIRAGAYDFITKPFDLDVLDVAIARAVRQRRRPRRAAADDPLAALGGDSPAIAALRALVERVAASDASVLVRGETGTGKELVARALHGLSARRDGPFVAINCAAMPEALLESELFGHVKGAFSGAVEARPGLFQRASGGTLLLDEVGDMSLPLQAKLLRVLQERRARPVGGADERPFDVRVVAATHRDLRDAAAAGAFRADLLFRLDVIGIDVPPLRARGRDVLVLAERALAEQAARAGKRVTGLSPAAAERLLAYAWPGNVRELHNCIERAVALCEGERLEPGDLPAVVRAATPAPAADTPAADTPAADPLIALAPGVDAAGLPTLEAMERRYVHHVLDLAGGNKALAARVLGLDRKSLYRKLERWQREGGAA